MHSRQPPFAMRSILFAAGAFLLLSASADAGRLRDIRLGRHQTYVRCVFELEAPPTFRVRNLSRDQQTITIEISGVDSVPSTVDVAGQLEWVTDNRLEFFPSHSVCYLHLRTSRPLRVETSSIRSPWRLIVDLYEDDRLAFPGTPSETDPFGRDGGAGVQPHVPLPDGSATAFRPRIIVIDPGHGGRHRGGLGRVGSRRIDEGITTLPVGQKLYRLLSEDPMFEPRITRDRDVYVSLADRRRFAERQNGNLFLSIHYNAVPASSNPRSARGMEIYTWSFKPGDSAADRYLKALDNEEGAEDVANASQRARPVLSRMMQDALETQALESKRVASAFESSFLRDSYFKRYYRGIKSDRFKVLENYNMPSVLVEVGYISHPDEAKLTISPEFQEKVARLLYEGIVSYYERNDPEFRSARRMFLASR